MCVYEKKAARLSCRCAHRVFQFGKSLTYRRICDANTENGNGVNQIAPTVILECRPLETRNLNPNAHLVPSDRPRRRRLGVHNGEFTLNANRARLQSEKA